MGARLRYPSLLACGHETHSYEYSKVNLVAAWHQLVEPAFGFGVVIAEPEEPELPLPVPGLVDLLP